ISDMHESQFDAVLLPGGFMPDRLRRLESVKKLIRDFAHSNKCVAAICHGGWLAISAGVYRGVKTTGSLGIKDDLENAGAIWVDAPVVVDRHFVSSRKPDDLPWFAKAMVDVIAAQR
ncbi:MAG: DJ-1/PfpI family protein, partial [Pirellula sp.]